MKIIFLDIDGVLVTKQSMERNLKNGERMVHEIFDTEAVNNLSHIIRETGAKIVVSSTWRLLYKWAELMEHFEKQGVDASHIIDKTPDLSKAQGRIWIAKERGDEIQAWLDAHPEVTRFVIIDDDADMAHLLKHLVSLDFETGLTKQCADETIRLLRKD